MPAATLSTVSQFEAFSHRAWSSSPTMASRQEVSHRGPIAIQVVRQAPDKCMRTRIISSAWRPPISRRSETISTTMVQWVTVIICIRNSRHISEKHTRFRTGCSIWDRDRRAVLTSWWARNDEHDTASELWYVLWCSQKYSFVLSDTQRCVNLDVLVLFTINLNISSFRSNTMLENAEWLCYTFEWLAIDDV